MAGDWIKMRVNLSDDPAVIAMAEALQIDEFSVVGRLHRLWSWADQHTTDGTILRVSLESIDRRVSCEGFASAMCDVGWLKLSGAGIEFPDFEKHNGKSAKKRAENTKYVSEKRQKRVKEMSENNSDNGETKVGPEKRREEKNITTPLPPSKGEPAAKKSQLKLGDISFPAAMDCPEVRKSMSEWLDYKQGRNKTPYAGPSHLNRLLERFAEVGPADRARKAFCDAVNKAIVGTFMGIPDEWIENAQRQSVDRNAKIETHQGPAVFGTVEAA